MPETEMPIMYTEKKETEFIRWNLAYTEDRLIETFASFPEDRLLLAPADGMDPPALLFTNTAIKEAIHCQGFNQGVIDIPEQDTRLPHWKRASTQDKLVGIADRQALIALFKGSRQAPGAYLNSLRDEGLKKQPSKSILPEGNPNRTNPNREALVMSSYQQNRYWEIDCHEGNVGPTTHRIRNAATPMTNKWTTYTYAPIILPWQVY